MDSTQCCAQRQLLYASAMSRAIWDIVRGGVCRKFVAEARFIQIVGAVQLLLAAWALLSSVSAGTQPLVACELHGCDAGVAK